jgi:hypothetical protein
VSRGQRIGLVAAVVVVAIVAFVIAQPGSDDSKSKGKTSGPDALRLDLKGNNPVGGVKVFRITRGDQVRLVVRSDTADEVHLHGYDIEKEVAPGKPARFAFKADTEGSFEIETHKPVEKRVATLQVRPG